MSMGDHSNTTEVDDKKDATITVRPRSASKASTSSSSFRAARVARFAEATTVESPIELQHPRQESFAARSALGTFYQPQPQPADVGFGYLNASREHVDGVEMPYSPATPLKSAMKTPKTATFAPNTRGDNPLSPTFKEEGLLKVREKHTEKEQKRDLRSKIRVRIAKMILRSTNFACSLIVLGMLGTTFSIFHATRAIPPRNNLPPWAEGTNPWAQIVLLVISCVSLVFSLVIFYGYWKGGHARAERAAVWYTVFSVAFFTFSIVMWGIGAGVLHSSKANGNGQDLWGWSCKDNTRKQLFQSDVSYSLICRLQNWSLVCCLIEIVVETITILIYGITFHRYYSKHKLHKSMDQRDKARSDFFLAQLRSSQPNTPGAAPYSARDGFYNPLFSARWAPTDDKKEAPQDELSTAEEGGAENVRYLSMESPTPKPFTLQAPPIKGTPKPLQMKTFDTTATTPSPDTHDSQQEQTTTFSSPIEQEKALPAAPEEPSYPVVPIPVAHAERPMSPAAPGEQIYGAVPIPGAYGGFRPNSTVPLAEQEFGSVPIPSAYTR